MSPTPEKLEEFRILESSRQELVERLKRLFGGLISGFRREGYDWEITLIGFIVEPDCIHPLVSAGNIHFALGGRGLEERFSRTEGESRRYDVDKVLIDWHGNLTDYPVFETSSPFQIEVHGGEYIISNIKGKVGALVFSDTHNRSTYDAIKHVAPDMEHLQALVSGLEAAGLPEKRILVEAGT